MPQVFACEQSFHQCEMYHRGSQLQGDLLESSIYTSEDSSEIPEMIYEATMRITS